MSYKSGDVGRAWYRHTICNKRGHLVPSNPQPHRPVECVRCGADLGSPSQQVER